MAEKETIAVGATAYKWMGFDLLEVKVAAIQPNGQVSIDYSSIVYKGNNQEGLIRKAAEAMVAEDKKGVDWPVFLSKTKEHAMSFNAEGN